MVSALIIWPTLTWGGPGPGEAKFEEGVRAFEKRSYVEAVAAFSAAYDASHKAMHLWNLALAEIKADRPWNALNDLHAYMTSQDASPQNLERARQLIERLKPRIGHLAISAPDGAEIVVDGSAKGKAPLGDVIDVDPAEAHVVEAHLGQRVVRSNVGAPGNARVDVVLDFPEDRPASPLVPHVAPLPVLPATAKGKAAPVEEDVGASSQNWLGVLFLTEVAASAASGGIGVGLFMDGSNTRASGRQILGGALIGTGVLFLATEVLTLRLWPREGSKRSTSRIWISPSLGEFSLHGDF